MNRRAIDFALENEQRVSFFFSVVVKCYRNLFIFFVVVVVVVVVVLECSKKNYWGNEKTRRMKKCHNKLNYLNSFFSQITQHKKKTINL